MDLKKEVASDGRTLEELICRQFGDWELIEDRGTEVIVEWGFRAEGLGVYRGKVVREGEYYSDWEISYEVDPPPRMEDIIPASILDQVDDRCKQALCQRWRGWHADGGSVEYIGLSSRGVVYLEVVEAEALMAVAIAQSGRMAAFPVPRREMNADLYYVDVPKKDADGDWTNVREFGSFDEASEFVQGEFGATVDGWVCLISAG